MKWENKKPAKTVFPKKLEMCLWKYIKYVECCRVRKSINHPLVEENLAVFQH